MLNSKKIIELKEYEPALFSKEEIPESVAEVLWHNFKNQIDIEFPTIKTNNKWQLTSLGWVGHIPLEKHFSISLAPKTPLSNLFRMLEYAYRLKSFHFLDGLIDCDSLQEFYERIANVLSLRVIDRGRKGFYHSYLPFEEELPFIRGRMDIEHLVRKPWNEKVKCFYEEHTSDIEDNQIIAWSLLVIARSGMCTERVLPNVRRAFRAIQGFTTLTPHLPESCVRRLYNRLNADYEPIHALCRFVLEQSGPTHTVGEHTALPFIVNMARLYELFVAEWLKKNIPPYLFLKVQEKVNIGKGKAIRFEIDLVIYDKKTGKALYVLDTKYKIPDTPDPIDISKVNTYADSKGCNEAILIYPLSLKKPIDETIGDNRIRNLTFKIDGDLDEAGSKFLDTLLK